MSKKFLFVNENIFTFNSGTEFSAMNRIKLFKQNNVDAKIVTRNFNPTLHQEIKNTVSMITTFLTCTIISKVKWRLKNTMNT